MMASIGAAARRGLLIKGGRYIERLPGADVLLIDKTGTVTTGVMQVREVTPEADIGEDRLVELASAAEYDSQHPLGRAIVTEAERRGVRIPSATGFESHHGSGVSASVEGNTVEVRKSASLGETVDGPSASHASRAADSDAVGTLLDVHVDKRLAGRILITDSVREGAREALAEVRRLGIDHIELLTGDNERIARSIAEELGVGFQADLLPEQKIEIVRHHQAAGRRVIMVGDGVNDAPALVQADVGIAMGAIGSDVAIESAHVCLLREDWALVPGLLRVARRSMRVVYSNIALTTLYNVAGLTLAALGILPPILAAAAQSIPDVGILANSSRLLRQKAGE
jgi:Cd2+/Zn2+-exporting ATPase/Cu+-exporting ATPase